ncbi:transcription initiation factor tfiid/supt3-related [Anaeramoeba flamelloides]|uniref:Transcription initiation factor TFIID subunit 13 n=1 Tax=Anaeramoeba flamelloides TaxID=1746091 RepID=A0AAV7ZBR4_9EUKA|nr:transcription initiation factor tfiid/supt3-related [Anaeramoeba flamelloides]KAJ6240777.1 transcription initiation factor tfiid/supt3-related [Anaeramoeba flamelloides]
MSGKQTEFNEFIKNLLIALGDPEEPNKESIDFLDTVLRNYVFNLTKELGEIGRKRGRLQTDDFFFYIRNDEKYLREAKDQFARYQNFIQSKKNFKNLPPSKY